MAEPTVQVPVSLIERLGTVQDDLRRRGRVYDVLDEVVALLSQPTPTAEDDFIKRIRNATPRTDQSAFDMETQRPLGPPAALPSIADMVPDGES